MSELLSIGDLSRRAGVPVTALRFYEARGLITSIRAPSGHRRFHRETLRRVAFIRAAQRVGLTLGDVQAALASLPEGRTPTAADWTQMAEQWRARLDQRMSDLARLRDQLGSCIGCGCLSIANCALYNPDDVAGASGPGPRLLFPDELG